ncbi:chorismate-binding protein [Polaromonas sp. SM01]|uniref:chorismate-binding protein n=1 Tax=Polaromonas sp. SM01 TaxID=3085630 RepID=UPI0029820076|nr:chorismate-binding protein [Polaromonas sp. SM01]MDW5441883.1 chorismate-binding protein [Polaromonas sp. SM01]
MLSLQTSRRPATQGEAEQALAQLDKQAGAYFGCDAGIAGLHPLQATLLDRPALSLRLYGDGLAIQAHSALGQTLLDRPELSDWAKTASRGQGQHPIHSLRAFMAAFAPAPEVILLGALPFNAHRLAAAEPQSDDESLGLLFFAEAYWQRDADGSWQRIELTLPNLAAATPPVVTPALRPISKTEPQDDYPPGAYADMVARALVHLREQPLVSLTLSQSYRRRVSPSLSPAQAFARLRQANPAPAAFFLNDGDGQCLFGASPDLQLVLRQRVVEALPVCGTVARGPGPVGEAESFRELVNEDVDAASLAVCTDALRNDLAPLCEPGSLRLLDRRRPMSLSTVVHTVDRFSGRLREGADAWDAIVATAAPVMVTGTPRRHALAAIAQLEASPRGWYGGLMVRVSADGDALAGTILRAAAIRDGLAEVRTGGDLMADSTPAREEQESRLKAISLWRALGIEAAAQAASSAVAALKLPARVALHDAGDPFPAAVRETLQGLGLVIDAAAEVDVLMGADAAACRRLLTAKPRRPLLAIGDAALRVLEQAGFAVTAIAPEHGRIMRATMTSEALASGEHSFITARYASLALADHAALLPGWSVWAHDEQQRPVLLAHTQDRVVCLLFRPDSLMSSAAALQSLRAALAWAANGI